MTNTPDMHYMHAALSQARRGLGVVANSRPSVGCILVKHGVVIAAARTGNGGAPHAEVAALMQAGPDARGATAYVTLEPCSHHGQTPPCTGALIEAGIKRVVVACEDPDPRVSGHGLHQLKAAGIEVDLGLCKKEAQLINQGFFLNIKEKRPMVTLKIAASQDGKIAPKRGEQGWITGQLARRRGHLERSMHDAILVGVETALIDDPALTTRLLSFKHSVPRIILDTNLRLKNECNLVSSAQETPLWVVHSHDDEFKAEELKEAGVKLIEADTYDLKTVMACLVEEGITRLLVEGGSKIYRAFIEAEMVDRVLWFTAPQEIGNEGVEALGGLDIDEAKRKFGVKAQKTMCFGEDLLEIYERHA